MSHDTAKRYYDRHTKMEQFKKGDYVYVHNPVYKRGKAKKFSYQYEGPFEVEQRISSLIYKIRLGDGTSTILYINRLKRAHKQDSGHRKLPEEYIGERSVQYRFRIDYRASNAVTKSDAYPILNIINTLDSLGKSNIFGNALWIK